MEINFTQAEFFTLVALQKIDGIFGVDLAAQLPPAISDRQAIYSQGESLLAQRGLIAVNGNQVNLQPYLLDMMQTIAQPQVVFLIVRSVPNYGNQVFNYYGRNGQYIEHTQPDHTLHRLGVVGDVKHLIARFKDIFVMFDSPAPTSPGVLVNSDLMIATFQLALKNGISDARDALADNNALNAESSRWLTCIDALAFSGTIAIAQIIEGQSTVTHDIALFCGAGQNWLLADLDNRQARLMLIDPHHFSQLLLILTEAVMGG